MALSRRNKLTNVHPIEKILLAVMPIIVMGFVKNPIIIIGNILFFVLLHIKIRNNMKIVVKFALEIAGFAAFSSITFVFDYGWKYAGIIVLKSLSAGLCLSFFSLTTPIDQVLYLLSKNKWLKDICDIAKSMERFLVIINEEYNIMYSAMKSRGGFDNFSLKIKSTGKMAALLFVNTMTRWESIKEGINSRCYRGYMPYLDTTFDFSKGRFALIFFYDIILILCTVILNNKLIL
ncbi:cobalt ECF transporter T component CbiQ [Clostridium tetanomorphum]|uniref:Cobalt ECF transporter T component CbiQ n=2 Tax=Clostridium tetanomorphum TaxID=1553 RepID=A0A923ECB6_CLOTT|nr:cobalt ECF transporter T component CbiQ [Clostridium tetanomorphum]